MDKDFEDICAKCGICCGAIDTDPCVNLKKNDLAKYYCQTYANRLGPQKTLSGKTFTCITIRELIKQGALRLECAYNNK